MTDIDVTSLEDGSFGVQVREGDLTTSHVVRMPEAMVDDLQLEAGGEDVVRESIGFLLEREPAASIASELSLEEIARSYPEYYDELRLRLGPRG
jgi:hypothetical protein